MSDIIKVPYEISIWEDYQEYTNGVANSYLSERKIGVIGSDTMTSPLRVVNPVFNKKVNGEKTLKFDIYSKYEENGELVDNVWCPYLVNERKVKLKYDGEWYDFIIKNVQETSTEYKYSYECTDLAVNELSKTGFSLEFDTELQNNCGTVNQLGSAILDNCDWALDTSNEEVIIQQNNEVVYEAVLGQNLNCFKYDNTQFTIESGKTIYIYYSTYLNEESSYYQFIYFSGTGQIKTLEDGTTIDVSAENVYELYCKSVPVFEKNGQSNNDRVNISSYRADKKIRSPEKTYDPILGEYVTKYKKVIDDNQIYYGYSKSQYLDATSVVSYAANGENFKTNNYWKFYSNDSLRPCNSIISAEIFPRVNAESLKKQNFNQYLTIQVAHEDDKLLNDGINQNKGKIDNFTIGEEYLFSIKYKNCADDSISPVEAWPEEDRLPFDIGVYEYTITNSGSIVLGAKVFNVDNATPIREEAKTEDKVVESVTYYVNATCIKNKSYKELLQSKCGLFIESQQTEISTTSSEDNISFQGKIYFIQKFEFFKKYIQDDSFAKPGEPPISNVIKTYYYYLQSEAKRNTSPDTYNYEYKKTYDSSDYVPIFGTGNKQFEKMRSISEKESNRFNLIQTLCETFECWAQFNIEHESNGTIKTIERTFYEPWTKDESILSNSVSTLVGGSTLLSFEDDKIYYVNDTCTEYSVDIAPKEGKNYYLKKITFSSQNDELLPYIYSNFEYTKVNNNSEYSEKENYFYPTQKKVQNKSVKFVQSIDKPNQIGFSYGINLKSIQRTLDSADLVTKIIVKDNACEYATDGFCSIARADQNPIGENFAYNFDYYIRQGLIDYKILNDDLYGVNGLIPSLNKTNSDIKKKSDLMSELSLSILKLKSEAKVYLEARDSAISEREKCFEDLASPSIGYTYNDFFNIFDGVAPGEKVKIVGRTSDLMNNIYFYTGNVQDKINITFYTDQTSNSGKVITITASDQKISPNEGESYKGYDLGTGQLVEWKTGITAAKDTVFNTYKYVSYSSNTAPTFYNFRANDMIEFYTDGTKNQEVYKLISSIQTLEKDIEFFSNAYQITQVDLLKKQTQYNQYISDLKKVQKVSQSIEKKFTDKYSRYIQEGSWNDDNYLDDNLYYFDALNVLYTSAFPQVTYTIDVLELSQLDGYESYNFDVGDKTTIEDTEFFGWNYIDNIKTPAKEKVIVSEIQWNLDDPSQNKITIQNYKTQFEDLFQRIAASTQKMEYHTGEYSNAAGILTNGGTKIDATVLQTSINNASLVIKNSTNSTVEQGDGGIQITNGSDPMQKVLLNGAGIAITNDGGATYRTAITGYGISADTVTTGRLDTGLIRILNGSYPAFMWDKNGIIAYYFDENGQIINDKGVVFNQYGLYGTDQLEDIQSYSDVRSKSSFSLTWDGLNIGKAIKLGMIEIDGENKTGLALYNEDGKVTLSSTNDGLLKSYNNKGFTSFGLDDNGFTINSNNNFTVSTSGHMKANSAEIGGKCEIGEVVFKKSTTQTVGSKFIFKDSCLIESYGYSDGTYTIGLSNNDTPSLSVGDMVYLVCKDSYYECLVSDVPKGNSIQVKGVGELLPSGEVPTSIVFVEQNSGIITISSNKPNQDENPDNSIYSPIALKVSTWSKGDNGITYDKKLVIGRLDGYDGMSGYGLYCDNVYLNGSLMSKGQDIEAGIDTNGITISGMDQPAIIYSKLTKDGTTKYPFYVTKNGYLYAEQGCFSGSIKSAEIETAKIIGTGSDPNNAGLIINCGNNQDHNGISFTHGTKENLLITTNGQIKASIRGQASMLFGNQEISSSGRFRLKGDNNGKDLMYRKSTNGYNLYCL